MACQSKHIEKLETDFNMLYELVLGLAKSSHSLASFPEISISFVKATIKDEETVQQVQGDMANENAALEFNFQADTKKEALSGMFSSKSRSY
jgi:glutathionylspermidine synthase